VLVSPQQQQQQQQQQPQQPLRLLLDRECL
jgi:hypothetical protein